MTARKAVIAPTDELFRRQPSPTAVASWAETLASIGKTTSSTPPALQRYNKCQSLPRRICLLFAAVIGFVFQFAAISGLLAFL